MKSVAIRSCRARVSLLVLASLAACSEHEPYARPGEWRPLGANAANLRAMVADPADLYAGRAGAPSDGTLAALAVARLRLGAVKPLPSSSVAHVGASDTGGAATPGAEAGASGAGAAAAAAGVAP